MLAPWRNACRLSCLPLTLPLSRLVYLVSCLVGMVSPEVDRRTQNSGLALLTHEMLLSRLPLPLRLRLRLRLGWMQIEIEDEVAAEISSVQDVVDFIASNQS